MTTTIRQNLDPDAPLIAEGEGKSFYVSVIDGARSGLLAGPFSTHAEADSMVEKVRKAAKEVDPMAHFYAFGTCSVASDRRGLLNDRMGLG